MTTNGPGDTLLMAETPMVSAWERPAGSATDCRGRLLHGYLHKTSNSLCGIKGYASLIARGPDEASRPQVWARKIIAEVERLETIYRSVQDMAFPEQQTLGDDQPDVAVHRAITMAQSRHTNLRVANRPALGGQLLLPVRDLELVLQEIFANSAESRSGEVTVTVETGQAGDGHLYVALADDGPGIAPELLPQAMDPFVTTRDGHLGIGLARVDTIMDMYGLGWGLRSAPGSGTVVTLEVGWPDTAAAFGD